MTLKNTLNFRGVKYAVEFLSEKILSLEFAAIGTKLKRILRMKKILLQRKNHFICSAINHYWN